MIFPLVYCVVYSPPTFFFLTLIYLNIAHVYNQISATNFRRVSKMVKLKPELNKCFSLKQELEDRTYLTHATLLLKN